MKNVDDFSGVKAALVYRDQLLVYLRDNKPGLRFAGMWDFFGGGREADETPFECLQRELKEELGIVIAEDQVKFVKQFPAMHDATQAAYFMVVELSRSNVNGISFGSEGQKYDFVSVEDFFKRTDFIDKLKPRLQSYIDSVPAVNKEKK